jgi:hypothetical protein
MADFHAVNIPVIVYSKGIRKAVAKAELFEDFLVFEFTDKDYLAMVQEFSRKGVMVGVIFAPELIMEEETEAAASSFVSRIHRMQREIDERG